LEVRTTKAVLVVLALTIGGLIGWLYWSPRHTVQELRRAAATHDTTAIVRLVNFPEVHKHLIIDAESAWAQAGPRGPNLGALLASRWHPLRGQLLLLHRDRRFLNNLASPAAVAAIVNTGWIPAVSASAESVQVWTAYEDYPNTFVLALLSPLPEEPDTVRLLFRRHGLAWQVEHLRIPGHVCPELCGEAPPARRDTLPPIPGSPR
jgi:hypothetical protein